MSRRRKLGRTCSACGTGIFDLSKTGKCQPCFLREYNSSEENIRLRGERLKEILRTDKEAYARKCETLARNRKKAHDNPFFIAKLRNWGRELKAKAMECPETEAKRIAGVVAANKRRRHAWLPAEHREQYFKMIRHGKFKAREAKRIILDQIAADVRRASHTTDASDTMSAAKDAVLGSSRLLQALQEAAR